MKHTILPAAVILCGLLTGCAPAPETAGPVIAAEAAERPADKMTESSGRSSKQPEVTARKDSLTVKYLGTEQTIPLEKEISASDVRVSYDYNFDGFNDIFIRYDNDEFSTGEYWLWESEEKKFARSDAFFPEESRAYAVKPDNKTKLLNTESNSRILSFEWRDGKTVPVGMTQFFLNDWKKWMEAVYEFDEDFNVILVKRRYFSEATKECYKEEAAADYLRVTDSAVEYMNGREIVQSIGLDEIFAPDKPPAVEDLAPGFADKAYGIALTRFDLDNDGDRDLSISVKPDRKGETRYIYYRYDDKTDTFTRWEELIADGMKFVVGSESEQAFFIRYDSDEGGNFMSSYYKHGDNGPVLFMRTVKPKTMPSPPDAGGDVSSDGEEGSENRMLIFTYDENGSETIVAG